MKPIRTGDDVDDLLRGAKALAVMAAWTELGLFDALDEAPRRPEELPGDARAIAITVPVLRHLGLLIDHGDRVGLSATARRLKAAGQLPTARNFEILGDQMRMADVVKGGGPVTDAQGKSKGTDGGVTEDSEQAARFLDMLYDKSAESAQMVYESLAPLLPPGASVLDLGGGHGRYARTFVEAGHSATLFDFPHVLEYARKKHGEALGYLGGNFRDPSVGLGGPYDLIFLSNIVHGEPDHENRALMKRLAAVLSPGGHVVLKDMFLDEHGQDPENAVFFGLTMLFYTQAGQSPSVRQATEWLEGAGLSDARLSAMGPFQLLRARRP